MSIQAAATNDYYALTTDFPNVTNISGMIWAYVPSGTYNYLMNLSNGTNIQWSVMTEAASPAQYAVEYTGGGGMSFGANYIDYNHWHCLGFSISSGGALRTYLDGSYVDENPSATPSGTPTALRFGYSANTGEIVVGTRLYAAKLWNTVLTDGEMATEFMSYAPVKTASVYGAWLLSAADSTISDTTGNGHTLTRNGTSFTTAGDPPTIRQGLPNAFDWNSSATGSTTFTKMAGTNRKLLVFVAGGIDAGGSPTCSGVTCNTVAMTAVNSTAVGTTNRIALYELVDPTSGTLEVTMSGSTGTFCVGYCEYAGVVSDALAAASVVNSGTSATGTVTVAGTTAGNVVVAAFTNYWSEAIPRNLGADQTKLWERIAATGDGCYNIGSSKAAGGSVTQTLDIVNTRNWCAVAVELKVPAGGSTDGYIEATRVYAP